MKDEISDPELFSFAPEVRTEILTDLGRPDEANAVLAEKDVPPRVLKPESTSFKTLMGRNIAKSGQFFVLRDPSKGKAVIDVKPQTNGILGRVVRRGRYGVGLKNGTIKAVPKGDDAASPLNPTNRLNRLKP